MADTVVGTIQEMVGSTSDDFPKDVIGALKVLDGHLGGMDERISDAEEALDHIATGDGGTVLTNAQINAMF